MFNTAKITSLRIHHRRRKNVANGATDRYPCRIVKPAGIPAASATRLQLGVTLPYLV